VILSHKNPSFLDMTERTPTIIHADGSLLVIDKPSGLLSIPDGYDHSVPFVGRILEPSFGRLWVVHRLDKETSGVMVLARNAEAHSKLNAQFSEHQVSKRYHAIISGNPDWDKETIEIPLRANVGRRNRTAVDIANGKPALTRFRVLERFPGFTLLEARPETGRTHQIRAHLYDLGFAILSDSLYGEGEISPMINRLALHACSLTFWHPGTGRMRTFETSYPGDIAKALSMLQGLSATG
jgi:RluA family pseudouridine synthase